MPSIADRLRELIVANVETITDPDTVTADAQLENMGLESVSGLNLLLAMEEEFAVKFPEEMLSNEVFASPRSLENALTLLDAQ